MAVPKSGSGRCCSGAARSPRRRAGRRARPLHRLRPVADRQPGRAETLFTIEPGSPRWRAYGGYERRALASKLRPRGRRLRMRHIALGGLDVSRLSLGTMGMSAYYTGAGADDAESIRTLHRALDLGITFIDTAEVYGPYTNEELVGRAIADRRGSPARRSRQTPRRTTPHRLNLTQDTEALRRLGGLRSARPVGSAPWPGEKAPFRTRPVATPASPRPAGETATGRSACTSGRPHRCWPRRPGR
jgi:Aldo/keto reductase family